MHNAVTLARDTNQALGIGRFAIDFLAGTLGPGPSQAVIERTRMFHTDAVLCGLSALALGTNAPTVLREEALSYRAEDPDHAAFVFGSSQGVMAEKAVVANCSAVREWDSNGTNFGYRPELGYTAGEFGHNDFYPVAVAACQQRGLDGATALKAMVLIDEIRGRLAEVFSLKTYKIDHVVHGAVASAAVYGALMGATPEQIESAVGMVVAHYVPWRAIRAGKQLSDSKGASAALSTEVAVLSMKRAMAGFVGPGDIFRNPESLFRQFVKTDGASPFDLVLSHSGDDFAVMGMHFKLGLYEHQSAGALQAVVNLVSELPDALADGAVDRLTIKAYEPAFGIIGDPAKRDPRTRQSADHSMVFIVARFLRRATEKRQAMGAEAFASWAAGAAAGSHDAVWQELMLMPEDYGDQALFDPATRETMAKIQFEHGGPEYDAKYPDGIPTSLVAGLADGRVWDSGLVMYPAGHARNTTADLKAILATKADKLGALAFADANTRHEVLGRFDRLAELDAFGLAGLYDFDLAVASG